MYMHALSTVIPLANSAAVSGSSTGSYGALLILMGVLLALGVAGALLLLNRQQRHLKGSYETSVQRIEEDFRNAEQSLRGDIRQAAGWNAQVRTLRSEVALLSKERDEWRKIHPKYHRLTFNIGIIGWRGTGKTGMCLRLTDPLFNDLNATISSARGVEYDHSVITLVNKQTSARTEHVFKFIEWGGEYIIQAQNDLLRRCDPGKSMESDSATDRVGIQALVLVVDLAAPPVDGAPADASRPSVPAVNHRRIREQIEEHFDSRSLSFIINPTLMTYLQTVVVFINKADVLPGTPSEQEAEARRQYHDLLLNVGRVYPNYHVIIGSVSSDAGLLKLYSHLVDRILPDDVKRQRPLGRAQDPDIRGSDSGLVSDSEPAAPAAPAGPIPSVPTARTTEYVLTTNQIQIVN